MVAAMLTAAEAVEAKISKKGAPGDSALAITESGDAPESTDPPSELEVLTRQVESLTYLVGAIASASKKPFDFWNIRCYRCNQFGHFQNKCTNEPKRSAGPNRRMPVQTRRGQRNAFRRSGRPQYPIKQDEEEEEEEEDDPKELTPAQIEDQQFWKAANSGNY